MELYTNQVLVKTMHKPIRFWFVYLISIIISFQTLLVAYNSSTYIGEYVSPGVVGILYSLGALGSMLIFFIFPTLLKRFGNVYTTLFLMVVTIITLGLVGLSLLPKITITAFVTYLMFSPLLYLNIDIFSETLIGQNEGETGSRRGLALSLMSAAGLFAPLMMGLLVGDSDNLAQLFYVAVGIGILYIFFIVGAFRKFYDPPYHQVKIAKLLKDTWENFDIKIVFVAHFLLQLFFAWVVIYVPLYLATEVGLNWKEIGYVISFGLFAYVIFEYPIGIIADRYIGEKEMMAVGFLVLALTSASISYMADFGVLGWMLLMFASRVGASLVEATTESYFFKKVKGEDANLMSLFRFLRPFANLIGALLGSLTLIFLPLQLMFLVLAILMTTGIFFTLYLRDTK